MSLTAVRPYFRSRLDALGLFEWDDAFNFENIPEALLDGAYHIDANDIGNVSLNQNDLHLDHTVIIRTFIKGFRTPKEALDTAMQRLEDIYKEVLKPSNRVTQASGLRNVLLNSTIIEPISESNDNAVMCEISFSVRVHIDVC